MSLIISIFQKFFASIKKKLFWEEDWALRYDSMKFSHFPDLS